MKKKRTREVRRRSRVPGEPGATWRMALALAAAWAQEHRLLSPEALVDLTIAAAAGDLQRAYAGLGDELGPLAMVLAEDELEGRRGCEEVDEEHIPWPGPPEHGAVRYTGGRWALALECGALPLRSAGTWPAFELATATARALGRKVVLAVEEVTTPAGVDELVRRMEGGGGRGLEVAGPPELIRASRRVLLERLPLAGLCPLPTSRTDWTYLRPTASRTPTRTEGPGAGLPTRFDRGNPAFLLCCHCAGDQVSLTTVVEEGFYISSELTSQHLTRVEYRCTECGWYTSWTHEWLT